MTVFESPVRRRRGAPILLALVALLSSSFTTSIAAAQRAPVDPVLIARLARGAAPALLWWDRQKATRSEVASYLEAGGIEAHVFERLSGALVCAATPEAVGAMSLAPGALGVWGDRALEPALDRSVPTAFDGDPNLVWRDLGATGKGVGIAVIDTGVDATQPDLEYGVRTKLNVRALVGHRDVLGPSTDPCVADTYTDQLEDSELTSGHGTHVASVAAGDGTASGGRYRGVAPAADIVGVGIADTVTPQVAVDPGLKDGYRAHLSLLSAVAGINYALLYGIDGSLRVKVILAGWTQQALYEPRHPLAWAIADAFEFGVNVVFPAGNEGPDPSNCSAAETCHFNPWAAAPRAIAVAATPKTSRTVLEPYSSRGDPVPRQVRWQLVRYEPTLSAPGTGVVAVRRPGLAPYFQPPGSVLGAHGDGNLLSFDRRYVGLTGTSVAAAHVAGTIAVMQQAAADAKGCYLTSAQVVDILRSTASPMAGYPSWDVGAGALDATAAVLAARSAPVVPSPDPWMCPPPGGG